MTIDLIKFSTRCKECGVAFEALRLPRQNPETYRVFCPACRHSGWGGFLYAPVALLGALVGHVIGFLFRARVIKPPRKP